MVADMMGQGADQCAYGRNNVYLHKNVSLERWVQDPQIISSFFLPTHWTGHQVFCYFPIFSISNFSHFLDLFY